MDLLWSNPNCKALLKAHPFKVSPNVQLTYILSLLADQERHNSSGIKFFIIFHFDH